MNREELLDKLAMELGEWSVTQKLPSGFAFEGAGRRVINFIQTGDVFYESDWQTRRAELINKPSWDDAPKEALYLAQNEEGRWFWYLGEPKAMPAGYWGCREGGCYASDGSIPANHDWRKTLERRPDEWQQGEERIDRIAQSDGSGEHYAEAESSLMDDDLMACIDSQRHLHEALQAWEEDERVGAGTPAGEPEQFTAAGILTAGRGHMRERAATYDKPKGERSMSATVRAFQATTGIEMTEEQGWHFMALLKLVRSQHGALRMDSYEDGAAYIALAGEAAAKTRQ